MIKLKRETLVRRHTKTVIYKTHAASYLLGLDGRFAATRSSNAILAAKHYPGSKQLVAPKKEYEPVVIGPRYDRDLARLMRTMNSSLSLHNLTSAVAKAGLKEFYKDISAL